LKNNEVKKFFWPLKTLRHPLGRVIRLTPAEWRIAKRRGISRDAVRPPEARRRERRQA
jgi:hypothetical protein